MRVELRPYDGPRGKGTGDVTNTGGYLANRSEVYARNASPWSTPGSEWPDPLGALRWYRITVLLPSEFALSESSRWLTLAQWKGFRGGSPPVALEVGSTERARGTSRTWPTSETR